VNRKLVVLATLLVFAVAELTRLAHSRDLDLGVYRLGVNALLHGEGLYSVRSAKGFPFTYPPFAALVLMPLGLIRWHLDQVLWSGLSCLCLVVLWQLSLRGLRLPRLLYVVIPALSCLLEPVWQVFHLGQIGLLLTAAIVADVLAVRNPRWRGVLTGVAAGIKLTPLVFLPFFAITRQWRALANATASLAATVAIGFVVLPHESWHYWTKLVFHDKRIGNLEFANNQSINAALLRLHVPAETLLWAAAAAVVAVVGLIVASRLWRGGDRLLATGVIGLVSVLDSPVAWTHHWVWTIPIGVGLGRYVAARVGRRAGVLTAVAWWALFVIAPHIWVPRLHQHELHWRWWVQLPGNAYVWAGLLVLGLLAVHLRIWERRAVPGPAT
jgi:alpha-1,2-mannosyltransferase